MKFTSLLLLSLTALASAGCDLPKDPEGTLERVKGGPLRVGIAPGNERAAAEDRLIVAALAQELGSEPVYRQEDTHALFHELEEGRLDLIIGGVPADTPFFDKAGLTRKAGPLFRVGSSEKRVLAVKAGENAFLLTVNKTISQTSGGSSR